MSKIINALKNNEHNRGFYNYYGQGINIKWGRNFKHYHIFTKNSPKFANVQNFLQQNIPTCNRINNNVIMDGAAIVVERRKYFMTCSGNNDAHLYNKLIFVTTGTINNGNETEDAIIIHCKDDPDKKLSDVVDVLSTHPTLQFGDVLKIASVSYNL